MKKSSPGKRFKKVMKEFGEGKLHSGSKKGPKVSSAKQAAAIAYSEQRRSDKTAKGMKNAGGKRKARKK